MQNDLLKRIQELELEVRSLRGEYYNNNFSAHQVFNKYSDFTSRLKVPHYSATPSTCEVGEICEVSGKLRICSSANTWTIVGTQT